MTGRNARKERGNEGNGIKGIKKGIGRESDKGWNKGNQMIKGEIERGKDNI